MATMIMWVGGLLGIEPNIRIRKLISNRKDLSTKLPAQLCAYNRDWNWDGVEFYFLRSALDYSSENNNSCVVQIRPKVGSVLLTGDIEREAEAQLERSCGRELASEVWSRASWCSLLATAIALVILTDGLVKRYG